MPPNITKHDFTNTNVDEWMIETTDQVAKLFKTSLPDANQILNDIEKALLSLNASWLSVQTLGFLTH